MCLLAQTPPHVPAPAGQVWLHSFSHVPQNAADPAANVGVVENTVTDRIVANTKNPIRIIRMDRSIEAFGSRQSGNYATASLIRQAP